MEVTMLDCIKRTPRCMGEIIENAMGNTQGVISYLGEDINNINEIVVIGSGSSHNAAVTANSFMEKVAGLPVRPYVPNQFVKKELYNPEALYVFVSQTGTSALVEDMVKKVNDMGFRTMALTEHSQTPVSLAAHCHMDVGCGYEEFGYRTVGFCCTIFSLQLLAMRIGLERENISEKEFDLYLDDARKVLASQPQIVEKTLAWFQRHQEVLKKANTVYFYGSGELYGIAIEAALKLLETARLYRSVGYEAEDGLHGPNLGFMKDDIVISMCDGENDVNYSRNVVRFAKNELLAGYSVGDAVIDEDDLQFKCASRYFKAIEFAAVVEIIAYQMAVINDVPVQDLKHRVPHVSTKYFVTHRG